MKSTQHSAIYFFNSNRKMIYNLIMLFLLASMMISSSALPTTGEEQIDWKQLQENDYIPESWEEYYLKHKPSNDDHRIVGGEIATRNAFPYQVGLGLVKEGTGKSWCGGSIISPRYILTAAHCLDEMTYTMVLLGAHDRENSTESGRITIRANSSSFIIHEEYDRARLLNDIALIKLPSDVEFKDGIGSINLPRRSQISKRFVGEKALISGWGRYEGEGLSKYLRYANSKVVNNTMCMEYFGYLVRESVICLDGDEKRGTCHGDSGGPMVIQTNGRDRILVGLTSFGNPYSCQAGWPTAYTRITSHLEWISDNTEIPIRS